MKDNMISTGVDIIEIERVHRIMKNKGHRFLNRIFAPCEIEYITKHNKNISSIAARFCAKEAVAKALGTGIGDISWRDIMIFTDNRGKPFVELKGRAKELLNNREISLSISHSKEFAVAFAVIYG